MNTVNDPIALRLVARYHSQQSKREDIPTWVRERHKGFLAELKAKLKELTGTNDIKTPEAYR